MLYINHCCSLSFGAAIDYKNVSVSLCYDCYDYDGGGGGEAYFIENIESIHTYTKEIKGSI